MTREVAAGVRVLLAPNPGMMTGPGTNTYLLGDTDVTVVDPGPALPQHLDAIVAAAGGRLAAIWLTHAHPDHAAAVGALRSRTGAPLYAWLTPNTTYAIPDLPPADHPVVDGCELVAGGRTYRALYTPGHASDHLCFFRPDDGTLLTGDVVIGQGTVVIAPPDGDLVVYLATLRQLAALNASVLLPGHGDPLTDPAAKFAEYLAHRQMRQDQVLAALRDGHATIAAIVAQLYVNLPAPVLRVAARQVEATLIKLEAEGAARRRGEAWLVG